MPYDRAWIHDNPELFNILHAINNTSLKEMFLKDIEKMSDKGKTKMEIIDHYVRAAATGKVPGYRKPTVDTLGEQRRRDDGGSQAGAPQAVYGRDDRFTHGPNSRHYTGPPNDSASGRASPYSGYEQYVTDAQGRPYSSNEQASRSSRSSRP